MKVLVLGATGGTGRETCRVAAEKGHSVVALVRSADRAQNLSGATLVEGDARDEAALKHALAGCSDVISSLGTSVSPFSEVTLLSTATRALVRVMTQEGVRRLVCITGLGAGDSQEHGGFVFDQFIMPLLLRKVYEDKDRQEDIVRASGLVCRRPIDRRSVAPPRATDQRVRLSRAQNRMHSLRPDRCLPSRQPCPATKPAVVGARFWPTAGIGGRQLQRVGSRPGPGRLSASEKFVGGFENLQIASAPMRASPVRVSSVQMGMHFR